MNVLLRQLIVLKTYCSILLIYPPFVPLAKHSRLYALLASSLALSLYYASETTSGRNGHKRDREHDDLQNLRTPLVIVGDQLDQMQQEIQYHALTKAIHPPLVGTPMYLMGAAMKHHICQQVLAMECVHRTSRALKPFRWRLDLL